MSKKVKVLFAIDRMNIGGAPSVVFEQMKAIDKNKFEVFLLTLYPSKQANYFSQIDFIDEDRIKNFKLFKRSLFDVFTWFKIIKYLKKEKFDIVYTHLFLTNLIIRVCAWITQVPVIISTEHSIYFNKKYWQRKVDLLLSRFTNAIVVACKEILDFTSEQEKISKKKFVIVPNPVVLPDYDREKIEEFKNKYFIKDNDFIVLSLGRFQEEKGQIYLLKAIKELKNKKNIKCLIVGHGPLRGYLENKIIEYQLQDVCQVAVEPEDAKQFYYLGDVFVLPSLREGQSLVTYEALLAGVPVVAFELETIKEIIHYGYNGFLVKPKDYFGIARYIEVLFRDNKLLEELKKNTQDFVSNYIKENNIQKLESLFLNLLET